MKLNRRNFLSRSAAVGALALLDGEAFAKDIKPNDEALEKAAAKPVLGTGDFKDPVVLESIQLLKKGREFFVRVRSEDGAEGISVDNGRMDVLHPILLQLVAPYFVGKDARELEEHLFGVYRHKDNYKLQGLALWCCVAMVELAVLDLLGRIARRSHS